MISRHFLCALLVAGVCGGNLLADSHQQSHSHGAGCNCRSAPAPQPDPSGNLPTICAWRTPDSQCKDIYVRIEGNIPECTMVALVPVEGKPPGYYQLKWQAAGELQWQAFEKKVTRGISECPNCCKCILKIKVGTLTGDTKYVCVPVREAKMPGCAGLAASTPQAQYQMQKEIEALKAERNKQQQIIEHMFEERRRLQEE